MLPLLLALAGQALAPGLIGGAMTGALGTGLGAAATGAIGAGLGNMAGQLIDTGEVDAGQALMSAAGAGISSGFAGPAAGAAAGAGGQAASGVAQAGGQAASGVAQAGAQIAGKAPDLLGQVGQAAQGLGKTYFGKGPGAMPGMMMQLSAGGPSAKWQADEMSGQELRDSNSMVRDYADNYLRPTLQRAGVPQSDWGRYGFGQQFGKYPGYQEGGVRQGLAQMQPQQQAQPQRRSPGEQIGDTIKQYIEPDVATQMSRRLFGAEEYNKTRDAFIHKPTVNASDYASTFSYVVGRPPSQEEINALASKGQTMGGRMTAWTDMAEMRRKAETQRIMGQQQPADAQDPRMAAATDYVQGQKATMQARDMMNTTGGFAAGGAMEGGNLGLGMGNAMMQAEGQTRSRDVQKIFDLLIVALSGELPEDQAQAIIQLATQTLGPEAVQQARDAVAGGQDAGKVVAGEPSAQDNVMAQDAQTGEPIKLASGEAILPAPMVEAAGGGLAGAKNIVAGAAQAMPQMQPHAQRFMQNAHG